MKKHTAKAAVLLASALTLTACGSSKAASSQEASSATESTAYLCAKTFSSIEDNNWQGSMVFTIDPGIL